MTPWLVLILGLAGTYVAWRMVSAQEASYQESRLEASLAQTREAVDHRIEEHAKLLLGAQGLVAGRANLTAAEWRAFVASLDLRRFSPGTRLMAYVPRESLEARPGPQPLLEPEGIASLFGPKASLLLSNPRVQEAITWARDQGELATTGHLALPGDTISLVGFFLPVYRNFAAPGDTAGRRAAFQGVVVCLADATQVFRPMFGVSPIAGLDVEVYDDPACREADLVYDRDLCGGVYGVPTVHRPWARRVEIPVGGRRWTLVVGFVAEGQVSRDGRAGLVAWGGAAVSLLAFGLTLLLARGRGILETMAHQLQESEARFRSVADTASCAIFIYSTTIEYMNATGAQMTGYSLEEILGQPLWKVVHPLDQGLIRSRAEARLQGGSVPLRYEFRLLTKSGETRWIDFASGTVSMGGRTLGLGTAFDVTDRVLANEARLKVERKLLEAQKLESLGLLAGGVAHDFNNLLTVIQGNAGMIPDLGADAEQVHACLHNIEETCRRGSDLVRQMLAYSGRGRVHVQPIDLNRVIREITQLLGVSIPKSVDLRFELAEHLPLIEADASQMQQVVMNLVTNAAEAIGTALGVITLRSGTRELSESEAASLQVGENLKPGLFTYLEVEDTGEGMLPETLARIFDPFFTTKFTGRGLGLAAMQGIVRGHGGGVRILSAPKEGTIFRIYLPVTLRLEEPPAPAPPTPMNLWSGEGLVLVADDEPGIRSFSQLALERAGFQVVLAADGIEALELFRAHRNHLRLVLLDLTMPRMSGDEVLREIRALDRTVPVVLWSGYGQQEGLESLSAGFLRKPFSSQELLELVRTTLENGGGSIPGQVPTG